MVKKIVFICCFLLLFPFLLQAQQSRAEEAAQKKAEKAKNLRPYVPGTIEKWLVKITAPRKGLYPYFGTAFSGGGIALGPGYWKSYGDSAILDVHGAWSVENYKLVELYAKLPDVAAGSLQSEFKAKYVDAGHVSFYGLGNDTEKEDETNFGYNPTSLTLTETFRVTRAVSAGGGVEFLRNNIGPGDSGSLPSIEEEFNSATAPGLGSDPEYFNTHFFLAYDWRQSPGYTTRGGYYRVDLRNYNNLNDEEAFDFRRLDAELSQYVPIFRANQVLAFRALVSITDVSAGNQVPFFLTPRLGGSKDLRGFRGFRFRDRHRLLLAGEYRWTPSKLMDLVAFYERGKVASRTSDLDLSDLHSAYGFGVRFHTPNLTILRIELARSSETTRLIFDSGFFF